MIAKTRGTKVDFSYGERDVVVAGAKNSIKIYVDLDKSWSTYTLNRRIIFQHSELDDTFEESLVLTSSEESGVKHYICTVPYGVLDRPGYFIFSIVCERNIDQEGENEILVSENVQYPIYDSVLAAQQGTGFSLEWRFF